MKNFTAALLGITVFYFSITGLVAGPKTYTQPVTYSSSNFTILNNATCDNTGTSIDVENVSLLTEGFPAVEIIFHNKPYTKDSSSIATLQLKLRDDDGSLTTRFSTPKQGNVGVGGNPYFSWGTSQNSSGTLLARCVQGTGFQKVQSGAIPATIAGSMSVTLSALDCSPSRSKLRSDDMTAQGGLNGFLLADNNINKVVKRDSAQANLELQLIPPRTRSHGRDAEKPVGGNPFIGVKFFQCTSEDRVGDQIDYQACAAKARDTNDRTRNFYNSATKTWGHIEELGRCKDLF